MSVSPFEVAACMKLRLGQVSPATEQNQRVHRASYPAGGQNAGVQDALAKRAYAITSIIYASRVKKQSNFFILFIDIYLMGSGIKRRVFKILADFKLCYSYYSINYTIGSITKEAKVY